MASSPWTVTRHDGEVRVDLTDATSLDQVVHQAIVRAVEDFIAEDGITTVRLDGSALYAAPASDGFATLAADLDVLVEGQGLRFHVGPL